MRRCQVLLRFFSGGSPLHPAGDVIDGQPCSARLAYGLAVHLIGAFFAVRNIAGGFANWAYELHVIPLPSVMKTNKYGYAESPP